MFRSIRSIALAMVILVPAGACAPAYQPRNVPVPADCDTLFQRAAEQGTAAFSESAMRQLNYCQDQFLLRAEEEQAAYARYQAAIQRSGLLSSAIYAGLTLLVLLLDDNQ